MAFLPKNISHIIFVVVTLICSISSTIESEDYINQICPKTRNPSECIRILGPNHNANLQELGHLSSDSAAEAGFLAYDEVNVLIRSSTPPLQQRYQSCLGNYGRANVDLAAAKRLLKSNNYRFLPDKVSAALAEAAACDKSFVQPPVEPPPLQRATQYFQDATSVLSVVANRLAGLKI